MSSEKPSHHSSRRTRKTSKTTAHILQLHSEPAKRRKPRGFGAIRTVVVDVLLLLSAIMGGIFRAKSIVLGGYTRKKGSRRGNPRNFFFRNPFFRSGVFSKFSKTGRYVKRIFSLRSLREFSKSGRYVKRMFCT